VAPTRARAVALVVLAVLLFFTHVQPFAFLLAAALLLAQVAPEPASHRRRFAPLLVFAPAVLGLFLPWVYREFVASRTADGAYNFGRLDDVRPQYHAFTYMLSELVPSIAGAYQDGSDTLLFAAWAAVVAALIALGGRGVRSDALRLALLALVGYFAAPMSIQGQWNIAPRFAWIAALFAVAAIGEGRRAVARAGTALAVALTAAASLLAVRQHRQFDREAAGFQAILDALPPGQRVLSLIYDTRSAVFTQWPYVHFGQYAMAFRGGAAGWSLAKSPPFPVRHRRPEDFPAPDPFHPERFRLAEDGRHYDYFLARFGPAEAVLFDPPSPRPVLVASSGPWRLWRNPAAGAPR
jgi:hypothetical protein